MTEKKHEENHYESVLKAAREAHNKQSTPPPSEQDRLDEEKADTRRDIGNLIRNKWSK